MKKSTTMKYICNNFNKVFQCGYCDLQDIMQYFEPQYYNSGVYGGNCDVYINYMHDIAITTGYRNTRGIKIPTEIIVKYTDIAKNIMNNQNDYDKMFKALEENRHNFFNELNTL